MQAKSRREPNPPGEQEPSATQACARFAVALECDDYESYISSFLNIRDERIREHVQNTLSAGALWPDPLIQLNPSFQPGESIDELVAAGVLHPECVSIFSKKSAQGGEGEPLRLHLHQSQAVRAARTRTNYVLTTGTGSGKSLAYIVPIVDHVLRSGSRKGVRARAAAIFMRFSAVRFRSPRSIPP